jgi:hypothetical protein
LTSDRSSRSSIAVWRMRICNGNRRTFRRLTPSVCMSVMFQKTHTVSCRLACHCWLARSTPPPAFPFPNQRCQRAPI